MAEPIRVLVCRLGYERSPSRASAIPTRLASSSVRLESLNGHFVELTVTSYQFGTGQSTTSEVDWDANWLVIHGKAWDGTHSWEFDDPCMTTWEARELASWLRGLGNASRVANAATEPTEVTLWFTEPNLTFALSSASQGIAELAVYFNAESSPPTGSNDDEDGLGHTVHLTIPQADIAKAVGHWEQDLRGFPVR